MADIKTAFADSAAITITLASLASSATAGRESAVVDNSANKFLDALATITVKTKDAALANDKAVYVYVFGSEDGTLFTDNAAGGGDAAITLRDPSNLILVAVINCPTQNAVYRKVVSIAQCFGGVMPRKWGLVIRNYTGQDLNASGSALSYSGIYATN